MSSNSSDWMSLREDRTQTTSEAATLFGSISEITTKLASIEIENEKFLEIGCYFYRVSTIVLEFQTTEKNTTNTIDIFISLQKNISFAEELVSKFQNSTKQVLYLESRSYLQQLVEVVRKIGGDLSSILSSVSEEQKYVSIAVRSLSKEMKILNFEGNPNEETVESCVFSNEDLSQTEPEPEPEPIETDLYSINIDFSLENCSSSDIKYPLQIEQFGSKNSRNSSELSQYTEPLYNAFFCPLTKMIMEDPVTIETGVTYEKVAIRDFFKRFKNPNDIICPKTGQKLVSKVLNTNMALKATIEEWRERNEVARIKAAISTLSQASNDSVIFEALEDLRSVCLGKHSNKEQLLSMGILPLLVMLLEYKDRKVRCATLELLLQLVEDEDEVKEMVAGTVNMTILIKMLSSNHPPIRHTTLLLLLELSKSKSLCQRIGSTNGAILMLITIMYKRSFDTFASKKADEILRNLECFPENVTSMAENGYLDPLLSHLVAGTEEIQMGLASYLGESVLRDESKIKVAEKASPALIKMVQSRNSHTRKAAFRALKKISSHYPSCKLLIQSGILKIMVEEIVRNEPMNSKNEAASILANIFESSVEIESLEVPTIAYEIIRLLNNSTPDELNISFIRVLLCLTKAPQTAAIVVSAIKETEASFNLIELIDNPCEELQIAALKLLISLSPYMGHTLADRLCRTRVKPESLIQIPNENGLISEKKSVSVNFLAKLPHQNLNLNLALVNSNIVPIVLQAINIVQNISRNTRYLSAYFEGLVGILVRFTKTLYDSQVLLLARNYNFTYIFTELLTCTISDEAQRLSAVGLENLSTQSLSLSEIPTFRKPKNSKFLFLPTCGSFKSPKYKSLALCPVHRGVCSTQDTFCLLEAKAVEKLLACLDHEKVELVEAALSALCTLLDEKADMDKSVSILSEAKLIQRVLNVLKEHREEAIRKKSFWVIEQFLMKGGDTSASDISQDQLLPGVLVNAFHHGEGSTRQMAENILMSLNKMPSFTTNFTI